jgi:glycosyltransferase involved in cell wall biosynthesis
MGGRAIGGFDPFVDSAHMSGMRVLTIAHDFQSGGLQRVARNFALGYRRFGVESAYLGYRGGGPFAQQLNDADVQVFTGSIDEIEQCAALKRALDWRPDVIHIHRDGFADKRLSAMLQIAKASARRGTAAPVGVVETNVFGRVDYSVGGDYIDVHYLISRWCLWKWQRWSRILSPRPIGVVMPNLVMHTEFSRRPPDVRLAFRQAHGIPADALVLGRVGSLFEPKWSPIIFDAFSRYAAIQSRAWLLLVGMPAALRPALMAMPADIRQRVVVVDFMSDDRALSDVYSSMDVFLHASRIGESFGMVLAEALLCGVPVITLSTPDKDNSQIEVVGHETGGLVVANVAGMLEAMRRLEDPELRRCYADRGSSEIVKRFSAEALIPSAIDIAQLVSEGLSPAQLRRRLLARPQLCSYVSADDIAALMRGKIGRYDLKTLTLMNLVSNPYVYRAYRLATRQPI